MKALFMSDTHNKHNYLMPSYYIEVDFIFHSGDFTTAGLLKNEFPGFLEFFNKFKSKHKVLIAGNHELEFQSKEIYVRDLFNLYGMTYLRDQSVEIDGYKIYGTPWQREFCDWEFNLPDNSVELIEKFDNIPYDTDILLTHTPPFKILDAVKGKSLGEKALYNKVIDGNLSNLKIHSFGHIHEGSGKEKIGNTWFLNAAFMDDWYMPIMERVYIGLFDDDKNCVVLEQYDKNNEELYKQF